MLHKEEQIGDYRLEKFLGKGQFGEVWLAEKQIQFAKKKIRHALKFLINRGADIDLKHAQDEIDTWIEAGGHPNVISVLDMLVHEGNVVIVSEYADGGSLKDWLKLHHGKAPTQEKAVEFMIGILRGIEHLHSRNVVHRDLKPENILLQGDFPRITDFGISRIVSENSSMTQPIGSPSYMSPEAFLGNKSNSADLWAAGIILYEMLTGRVPFEGGNIFQLKEKIEKEDLPPLPNNISKELQEVVKKALKKDRNERIQTAHDMRLALETASYSFRKPVSEESLSKDATTSYDKTSTVEHQDKSLEFEKTLPDQTQPADTQIAEDVRDTAGGPEKTQYTPVMDTGGNVLDQTRDLQSLENEKNEVIDTDFLKLRRQTTQTQDKSSSSKLLMGGIAALLLVGLAVGGFFIFRPSTSTVANSNTSESNSNSAQNNSAPTVPEGMAYIPGGELTMGRDDSKNEAEKPTHKVTVKPFFMDKTEVTNEAYAEFVKGDNHRPPPEWKGGTYPKGQEKFPVIGVNWEDATAYAKWAGKRLPTEEEWEFAARGKDGFLYPWGNDWKQGNANAEGASKTFSEVGKFKGASPFGLYDMVGNAWEWTASDFGAYPNGKLPDVFKGKENLKTLRGGSFEATPDFATTTYRIGYPATSAENFYRQTGFRCAKDVEKSK